MAITASDLKLRQAERMTDFDDGGGRMSATEIVDNVVNNIFSDLSDADGLIGDVSLRKFFLQVDTDNTDTFLGPFAFLTDLPQNDNVNVVLFDTRSATDERAAAQDYVEAYRIKATKSQLILYGLHSPGQRTVQVFTREETPSPDIGDVLCLSQEADGYPANVQFVAVQSILSRVSVTFTDSNGDFSRDVIVIQTTTPLLYEFVGIEDPSRFSAANTSPTVVRFTQVSDSAKYYGFKACTEAPQTNDLVVKVGDPYVPIAPTTRGETPLVDQLAGLGSVSMIASGAANALTLSFSANAAAGVAVTRYFGTPFARHSLSLTIGGTSLRDDGEGGIAPVNPSDTGWSGVVDYQTGSWSVERDVGFSGTVTASATPAGAIASQAYSMALPVTAANRGVSYVAVIPGLLGAGTVTVDYLALGKWIRLRDNGRGQLTGAPGQGGGSVNYATGSIALTLGALPDVDSAILVAWGTDLRAKDSSGDITIPTPTFRQQLDHPGVVPDTLEITWTSGGAAKTATTDAAGAITGDATGQVDHTAGIVEFTTASLPDDAGNFTFGYSYVDPSKVHSEVFTPTAAGGAVSFSLAHAAAEHSVVIKWNGQLNYSRWNDWTYTIPITLVDDGSGGFANALTGTNTINYATGAIALTVEENYA